MTAVPALAEPVRAVTQARVVRSEWTKFWTVRSTKWSLLVATVLTIGFPILASTVIATHWGSRSPGDRANFNPLDPALIGSQIAQLAIGVLGVLVVTGEYSTGMIRASLTAVPKRLPVLWAKAGVFATVTLALMVPSVVIAFVASQAILSRHHASYSWHHPGVSRAVIGAGLYLGVVAVMTVGIGAILRSTAGAISAFAAVFFVLPPLMNVLPTSWNNAISPYLPSNAGRAIIQLTQDSSSLAPWTGFALFAGYAAVALALGAVLLKLRDA
ncbi:MAG TPA: ABC transporter permease subunit [Gaiellaceae bacterium]|jgi:ABC-type transport system involved in multi-copper enzyme maturation permease subunit|nr:ABC transporter permease subunit [Gaiellaceae bacterium]